ncbi:hypothetical protein C7212DRAFT_27630, partial [Tuber magnatum]
MSSCGLGSWARGCAIGYSQFDSGMIGEHVFPAFSSLGKKINKLIPGIGLARKIPPGGTAHHKPCETSPRLREG